MRTDLMTVFIGLVVLIALCTIITRATLALIETRLRMLWRVEAKLDLLLQHANIQFDPNSLPVDVVDAVRRGNKVEAIRLYRDATGARLKQALVVIDEAMRGRISR